MSAMPPMVQMPSTFVTQPPVLDSLPGLETQRSDEPVSDENEENDVRQHLTRQDTGGADEANALPSQRGVSRSSYATSQNNQQADTHPRTPSANVTCVIVRSQLPSTAVYVNGVERS